MEQLTLENMNTGLLPDGTQLNVGDIVRYDISTHMGITRVVLHEGKICMESNFMYGENAPIDNFLKGASYNHIKKLSLVDLYKLCKKNNWNTKEYIAKFGKKS
jgi:hypothetical protein